MPSMQFTPALLDLVFAKNLKLDVTPKCVTRRLAYADDRLIIRPTAGALYEGTVRGDIVGVQRGGRLIFARHDVHDRISDEVQTSVRPGRYGRTVGTITITSITIERLWFIVGKGIDEFRAEGFTSPESFIKEWNRLHNDSAHWWEQNPLVYRMAFTPREFYKEIYQQGRTRTDRPSVAAGVTHSKKRLSAHAHQ